MQNVEFRMTGLASHFNFQFDIFVKPDGADIYLLNLMVQTFDISNFDCLILHNLKYQWFITSGCRDIEE